MNLRSNLCLGIAFFLVAVIGFVLYCFPISVLCHMPIYDSCFVYKYYSVDENETIQHVLFRSITLSQSDTKKLFSELSRQKWSAKISNDWENHKIVFTTMLGLKFAVKIQTPTPDRVQINGSGAWLDSDAVIRIGSILNSYIIDNHVAYAP